MKLLENFGWDSWSKSQNSIVIRHESLAELSQVHQDCFRRCLDPGERIYHIITAPSLKVIDRNKLALFRGSWTLTPEWRIVMTDQRVLIVTLKQDESQPQLVEICFEDVLSITLGKNLLYSWVEWRWTQNKQVQEMRVFFNPDEERLFAMMIKDICRYRIEQAGLTAAGPVGRLHLLDVLPEIFKNLLTNRMLQEDEGVEAVVFSSAAWTRRLGIFRHLESPAIALLRTNYHILVMREDYATVGGKYGVVLKYFPLGTVADVLLDQQEDQACIKLILQNQGIKDTVLYPINLEDNSEGIRKLADFCHTG